MGLLKDNLYMNFKQRQMKRIFRKRTEIIINEEGKEVTKDILDDNGNVIMDDIFHVDLWVNIYPSVAERDNCIVAHNSFDMPYSESISDSDIYNLLKNTSVSYSDVFGQEVILDLTKAEDLI